jgi:hypothetical protein
VDIASRIESLRAEISDCDVVGFGDAQARLVLKAAYKTQIPREILDGYCAQAVDWFATAQACGAQSASGQICTVMTPQDTRLYLKAQNSSDFLFLILGCDSDIERASALGAAALQDIEGAL